MSPESYVAAAYTAKSNEFLVPVIASAVHPESKTWVLIAPPESRVAVQDQAHRIATRLPLPFHDLDGNQQASFPLLVSSQSSFVASVEAWYELVANSLPNHLGPTVRKNGAALARTLHDDLDSSTTAPLEAFRRLLMAIYRMTIPRYEVRVGFMPSSLFVPGHRQPQETLPVPNGGVLEVLQKMAHGHLGSNFRGRGRVMIEVDGKEDLVRAVSFPDPRRFDTLTLVTKQRGTYILSTQDNTIQMHHAATGQPVAGRIRPVGSLRNVQAAAAGTLGHVPWHAATRTSTPAKDARHITLSAREFLSPHWPNQPERAVRPARAAQRLAPSGSYLWDFHSANSTSCAASALGFDPTASCQIDVLEQIVIRAFGRREASADNRLRHARGVAAEIHALFAIRLFGHEKVDLMLRPGQSGATATPLEHLWALNAALRALRCFAHPQSRAPHEHSPEAYLKANGLIAAETLVISDLLDSLSIVLSDLWAGEMRTPGIAAARRNVLDRIAGCAAVRPSPAVLDNASDVFWTRHLKLTSALYDYMGSLITRIWMMATGVLGADLFILFLLLGPEGVASAAERMVAARGTRNTLLLPLIVNQKGRF